MKLPFELNVLAEALTAAGHEVTRMTDDPMVAVELADDATLDIERMCMPGQYPRRHAYYLVLRVYGDREQGLIEEIQIAEIAEGYEYLIPGLIKGVKDKHEEQMAKEDALWSDA